MKSVIAIVNVDFVIVGMNYNHLLVFDDWMMMMIIDFDRAVEYSASKMMMMTLNHERYFDEVMVENLLVVIQTIY
jgi:hypothetical protein